MWIFTHAGEYLSASVEQMHPDQGGWCDGRGSRVRTGPIFVRISNRFTHIHRYLYRRIHLRSFRLICSLAGRLAINRTLQISGCSARRQRSTDRLIINRRYVPVFVRSTQINGFLDHRWQLWQGYVWAGCRWGSLGRRGQENTSKIVWIMIEQLCNDHVKRGQLKWVPHD